MRKQRRSVLLLIIAGLGLILILFQLFNQQILRGRAATDQLESESAAVSGNVAKLSDSQASGG